MSIMKIKAGKKIKFKENTTLYRLDDDKDNRGKIIELTDDLYFKPFFLQFSANVNKAEATGELFHQESLCGGDISQEEVDSSPCFVRNEIQIHEQGYTLEVFKDDNDILIIKVIFPKKS